jgi:hypothetical protein
MKNNKKQGKHEPWRIKQQVRSLQEYLFAMDLYEGIDPVNDEHVEPLN